MIITKLIRQKKSKGRYSIFADDVFRFGVLEDTVFKFGMREKDELNEKRLQEIKDYDDYLSGKKIALNLLSFRNRSSSELAKKLKEKKIPYQIVEKIIEHLNEIGFLDDKRFAEEFSEGKINSKPVGKRIIKQKLIQKGIKKDIIDETLSKVFNKINEPELAEKCLRKYLPKVQDKDRTVQKKKVYEHLLRKGFDYDTINSIIRDTFSK